MDEKVVPITRAVGKGKKSNIQILLCVNKEISQLDDPIAIQQIRDTLRKVAVRFFSAPSLPD